MHGNVRVVSSLVRYFMLETVCEVLANIHTTFEVSRCLVCPTIVINICIIALIKKCLRQTERQTDNYTPRRLPINNGSLENKPRYIAMGKL